MSEGSVGYTSGAIQTALIGGVPEAVIDKYGKDRKTQRERSGSNDGDPVKPKPNDEKALPPVMSWGELLEAKLEERLEILQGILRFRCKLGIAGGAKAKKTWILLALACCVAAGMRWFGRFETFESKVLYVNLELHPDTIRERVTMICKALGLTLDLVRDNLNILNLRSYEYKDHKLVVPRLIEIMEGQGYGLCVIDPLRYSRLAGLAFSF